MNYFLVYMAYKRYMHLRGQQPMSYHQYVSQLDWFAVN